MATAAVMSGVTGRLQGPRRASRGDTHYRSMFLSRSTFGVGDLEVGIGIR